MLPLAVPRCPKIATVPVAHVTVGVDLALRAPNCLGVQDSRAGRVDERSTTSDLAVVIDVDGELLQPDQQRRVVSFFQHECIGVRNHNDANWRVERVGSPHLQGSSGSLRPDRAR